MAVNWTLMLDSKAIGRAGFGVEGGRASEVYVSDGRPTTEDLQTFLLETLGSVDITLLGIHKLNRTMPACHPLFPWLFADKVEFQGVGYRDADGNIGEPVLPDFQQEAEPVADWHWQHVRVAATVSYAPRPYAVLANASINPVEVAYITPSGFPNTDWDTHEYERFVDIDNDEDPKEAVAQQGQLCYRTGSGVIPPHTSTFSGFPHMMMPDGVFRVIWHQVPYSLYLNPTHPMRTLVGYINQGTFLDQPEGSLLYKGAKARRYQPLVPNELLLETTTTYSADKVCDITFIFEHTARVVSDPPVTANANWLAKGWNTQPFWRTRAFHYVCSNLGLGTGSGSGGDPFIEGPPVFFSAPMQFLFQV